MKTYRFLAAVVAAAVLAVGCSGSGDPRQNASAARSAEQKPDFDHHHFEPEVHALDRLAGVMTAAPKTTMRTSPGSIRYSGCSDSWITQAVKEVVGGPAPVGKVCDPYLYGKANWSSYPQLVQFVRDRFAMHCGDKWVTQAVMEVYMRVPQPFDCNVNLYNGGRWSSYQNLKDYVANYTSTNTSPDPTHKVLALVYRNTALPNLGVTGTPITTSMNQTDVDHVRATLNAFAGKVAELSANRGKVSLTIQEVTRPLSSVTKEGDGVWAGPADVRQELDQYAPEGSYDSVIVIWRKDDGTSKPGPKIQQDAVGLAIGRMVGTKDTGFKDGTNGAGFASITLPLNRGQFGGGIEPGWSVIIHEWIHSIEGTYRDYNPVWMITALPDCSGKIFLHCAEYYGYKPQWNSTGWTDWYRDVLQAKVSGSKGIWAEMWTRGGPRTLR